MDSTTSVEALEVVGGSTAWEVEVAMAWEVEVAMAWEVEVAMAREESVVSGAGAQAARVELSGGDSK